MKTSQLDTVQVYQLTDSVRILNYLRATKMECRASVVAKKLNINIHTVRTSLRRLKTKNLVTNDIEGKYGYWKSQEYQSTNTSQPSEELDSLGGAGVGGVYQVDRKEVNDLVQFLLNYEGFHGLESYISDIDVDTKFDTKYNGWYISLENRKLRVKCSDKPIPWDDAPKLWWKLEEILEEEINFTDFDKIWLTHIEYNIDLDGYELSGIQRVQTKTLLGNWYRLYNKNVDGNKFLRSETLKHFKKGVITLQAGLTFVSAAGDVEDVHTITRNLVTEIKKYGPDLKNTKNEIFHVRNEIEGFVDKSEKAVDYLQNQNYDVSTKLDQSNQINENILLELKNHTLQNEELIDQGKILEEVRELLRDINNSTKTWQSTDSDFKKETLVILREIGNSWQQIGDSLGVSKQAVNKFAKKYLPTLFKKVDTNISAKPPITSSVEVSTQETKRIIKLIPINKKMSKNKLYSLIGGNRGNTLKIIEKLVVDNKLRKQSDPKHSQRILYWRVKK